MPRKKKLRLKKGKVRLLRIEIKLAARKDLKELRKWLNLVFKFLLAFFILSCAFPIDHKMHFELIQLIIELFK